MFGAQVLLKISGSLYKSIYYVYFSHTLIVHVTVLYVVLINILGKRPCHAVAMFLSCLVQCYLAIRYVSCGLLTHVILNTFSVKDMFVCTPKQFIPDETDLYYMIKIGTKVLNVLLFSNQWTHDLLLGLLEHIFL